MKKHLSIISLIIIGLSPNIAAQDKAEAAKAKALKEKAAKQKSKSAKKPMTPEEREAYYAKVKGKYEYMVKFLDKVVAQHETRREELEALLEQEKIMISPPLPGLFTSALQPSSAKSAASAKKRAVQAKTLGSMKPVEVAVTQEIKDAAKAVIDAIEVHIPLIHDQADQYHARIKAYENPAPAAGKTASKASTVAGDAAKARADVDKAEADLSIVQASVWLNSVSQSQNAGAKDMATEATRSLAKYLALKKQYDELGAQLGVVSEQLDEGVSEILGTLYPRPSKSRKKTKAAADKKNLK